MHHADINAALIKKGINQAIIAEQLNVSPAAVTLVIKGNSTSRRIAQAISDATGIPVNKLWPGRYERSRRNARLAA